MTTSQPRLGTAFLRLEDRALPHAFGLPWTDAGHLTLSFVPDGTQTPLGPNSLSATMAPAGPAADWRREVLRAFQTWAVHANVNVGLVADGGQPLGSQGAVQGDDRFGDVRVAAAPLGSDLAWAGPFSRSGTTLAGDVVFNSAAPFGIGDGATAYDLFSVALHEAGHVLGIGHGDDAGSVMDESYAYHTGLSADDIADLQTLYGVRGADAFDATVSNSTLALASVLKGTAGGKWTRFTADGDLTTLADVDNYRFTVPTRQTSLTVRLQAKGLSLLLPSVTVYDLTGKAVDAKLTTDPLNNDVVIQLGGVKAGASYFVRVDRATQDVFGIGSYRLTVDATAPGVAPPPLPAFRSPATDGHANDTRATSTDLTKKEVTELDARFDATFAGVIEDSTDVDFYTIRAPKVPSGTPLHLNIMVWGLDENPLDPRVRVYDSAGNPVAFQVLANDAGVFSVQVPDAVPNATYYVQVSTRDGGGASGTGAYYFGADFTSAAPAVYQGVAGNTLGPAAPTDTGTLTLAEGGVYQLALSAGQLSAGGGGVTMTVTDSSGRVVARLDVEAGQPAVTLVQALAADTYTVQYEYRTAAGQVAAPIWYELFLLNLSDGVGTYPTRITSTSGTTATTSTGGYTYTGSSVSKPIGYAYYF